MRHLIRISAAAALLIAAGTTEANAQASATATATATIVTPISISQTANMNFGNVAVNATQLGTVVLSPAGSRTHTGGVTLPATAGSVTAASFTVSGQANYTYAITLPSSPVVITNSSNVSMNVDDFQSSLSSTGTLSSSGTQTLNVGARLNVAAAQQSGTYVSGTPFTVTVNYN